MLISFASHGVGKGALFCLHSLYFRHDDTSMDMRRLQFFECIQYPSKSRVINRNNMACSPGSLRAAVGRQLAEALCPPATARSERSERSGATVLQSAVAQQPPRPHCGRQYLGPVAAAGHLAMPRPTTPVGPPVRRQLGWLFFRRRVRRSRLGVLCV